MSLPQCSRALGQHPFPMSSPLEPVRGVPSASSTDPDDVVAFRSENPGLPLATSVEELQDLLGSVWLYIPWRHVTKQLTTREKELFAEAVTAWSSRLDPAEDPTVPPLWWRPDYVEEV